MNKFLFALTFLFTSTICAAQNFKGQWKGTFVDNSVSATSWGGNTCDYVIDLDVNGNKVTGYSYTYFTDGGQKYYTICKLSGFTDKKRKYVEVRETERTKTNVPVQITNSFQIHKLNWTRQGDNEVLTGSWVPAPGQDRTNTGFGTTLLTKRQLREIAPMAKINGTKAGSPERPFAGARSAPVTKPKVVTANAKPLVKNNIAAAKTNPKTATKPVVKQPVTTAAAKPPVKSPLLTKRDSVALDLPVAAVTPPRDIAPLLTNFEKRNNAVLETVSVENPTVKIELYDNGEVDGDSISVFYNGKVLLAHRRLSEKPITLEIPVDFNTVSELVMYADNLGTIPPNTALMIVRDGSKRYEVRITSDLKKSGTIRFIHKQGAIN
jgi:hypothetical protein